MLVWFELFGLQGLQQAAASRWFRGGVRISRRKKKFFGGGFQQKPSGKLLWFVFSTFLQDVSRSKKVVIPFECSARNRTLRQRHRAQFMRAAQLFAGFFVKFPAGELSAQVHQSPSLIYHRSAKSFSSAARAFPGQSFSRAT